MSRQILTHDPVDRFVVGTVGVPGERTFFIQARTGELVTSVVAEKEQVSALADRLAAFLADVAERHQLILPEDGPPDLDPLDVPLVEEFRIGTIAFGWDPTTEQVLFEFHGTTDDDVDPSELADDEDGPPLLRVRARIGQVVALVDRARRVVAAGRPACPFCQQPLDPRGHICPRSNGYRR